MNRLRKCLWFQSAAMALAIVAAGATTLANAATAPAAIAYRLAADGLVTLVIDDAQGRRVRNLLGGATRLAGPQVEPWDGLDDVGKPVPAGEYRWRGLAHRGISSHFVGAFNSPGSPPWNTHHRPASWYLRPSGSGGWLSDHGRPHCIHAAGERIFIGSPIAEAGHSIIEVDADGHKQWGTLWLSLSGAHAIATDGDILYVAGEGGWMKDSLAVNRIDLKTYGYVGNPPALRERRTDACFVKEKTADFSGIRGLAVTPQYIVLSLADRDRLACFDRQTAAHVKDLPLPGAGALLKRRDGQLLGLGSQTVVQIDLKNGRHQPLFEHGLEMPSGLGMDAAGRLYIGDLAPAEQCVKVFSPSGEPVGRIGKPGGRHEGRFEPLAMSQPVALAIDDRDQIWVAEQDFLPKRVSVWSTAGELLRDFIGPPHYGGGGALDPTSPKRQGWLARLGLAGRKPPEPTFRAYYKGMRFAVPPWPQSSVLEALLFQPAEHPDLPWPASDTQIPQYPVHRGDRLYLVNDDGWGVPGVFIGEVVGDRLLPRVIFGRLDTLWKTWSEVQPEFLATLGPLDQPAPKGAFLWQDANDDGRAEPAEVTILPDWQFGSLWAMRSWPTLALLARRGDRLAVLAPPEGDGPLRYDPANAHFVPLPEIVRQYGIGAAFSDRAGNLLLNCGGGGDQGDPANVFLSLAPDGQVRWTYPNPYPANWHNSPLPRAGDIQHTLNVEGIARLGGEIGDIFQLNGNKGVRYLFTTDGLFVAQLFGDMRNAPLQQTLTDLSPGLRLDQHSLGDECFFGWMGRTADQNSVSQPRRSRKLIATFLGCVANGSLAGRRVVEGDAYSVVVRG